MKKFLACFAVGLTVLVASPLAKVKLIDTGKPLKGDGTYYVGPYTMLLNGRSVPVLCIDVEDGSDAGDEWTASINNLRGDLSATYHPDKLTQYEEAAYLFIRISEHDADRIGIQHAAWAIMDPGFKPDAVAAAWMAEAQRKYGTIDFSRFAIFSDSNGRKDARMQEFIGLTPVPEPYLTHVLAGLIAIGLILLGKRRG